MEWLISMEQLEDLATARPEPPYFLLFAGFFIIVTCELPLAILIRQRIEYWSKNFSANALPTRGGMQIILPFSGVMAGLYIATAAGLEILGTPVLPALSFSLLFILLISYIAWSQLGRALSRAAVRHYLDDNSNPLFEKDRDMSSRRGQLS